MGKAPAKFASPAASLYLLLVIAQVGSGLYLAGEVEPPPAFTLLYAVGFLWAVGWWLRNDSRGRGVAWPLDMGLFLYLVRPLILPYYLFRTRGARGLLAVLVFVAVYVAASAAGVALWAVLAS